MSSLEVLSVTATLQQRCRTAQAWAQRSLVPPKDPYVRVRQPIRWRRPQGFPRGELACVTQVGEREGWGTYFVSTTRLLRWLETNLIPSEVAALYPIQVSPIDDVWTDGEAQK